MPMSAATLPAARPRRAVRRARRVVARRFIRWSNCVPSIGVPSCCANRLGRVPSTAPSAPRRWIGPCRQSSSIRAYSRTGCYTALAVSDASAWSTGADLLDWRSWTVDHAGCQWGVTLHSPEEQDFSGKTLEEALDWCPVWLMVPERALDCSSPDCVDNAAAPHLGSAGTQQWLWASARGGYSVMAPRTCSPSEGARFGSRSMSSSRTPKCSVNRRTRVTEGLAIPSSRSWTSRSVAPSASANWCCDSPCSWRNCRIVFVIRLLLTTGTDRRTVPEQPLMH